MKQLIPSLLLAALPMSIAAQDLEMGGTHYERHCAVCHGADARGDGPMSQVLILRPTDLTQMTQTAGGVFPTSRIIARIDGRDPMVAHGSPMPVFGGFFEGKGMAMRGEDGILIMTSQPIIDIVAYLQSIQDATAETSGSQTNGIETSE